MMTERRQSGVVQDAIKIVAPYKKSAVASPACARTVGLMSAMLLCAAALCLSTVGCGYTVGKSFVRDIKTVDIPIFENDTNRPGVEKQLTEAVQKEVTKRSTYRLAKGLNADTRLTGRIVSLQKNGLGETAQDDLRELQWTMMVKVTWEDLRSGQVLAQEELPLSPEAIPLQAQAEFSPESGQSLATSMDDVFRSMARKIVNLMETPW